MSTQTQAILMESRNYMKSTHGVDICSKRDYQNMLVHDESFNDYKTSLLESVSNQDVKNVMDGLFDKTRTSLLESINSFNQLSNYETLALPLLTTFYPRLIAKELVTVRPIDAPDTIMPFLKYNFVKPDGTVIEQAPAMAHNITFTPRIGKDDALAAGAEKYCVVGSNDILKKGIGVETSGVGAETFTTSETSLERTFQFFKVAATLGSESIDEDIDIIPTVDGNVFAQIAGTSGTLVISGKVDWLTGIVTVFAQGVASDGSALTVSNLKMYYKCSFSLEQNTMNNKIKPTIEKRRLLVEDQEVSADWTIQMEQDANALFDLDVQSAIIDILGQQMALDVDKVILKDIYETAANNPASHTDTFYVNPPSSFNMGPVYWAQNIVQKLMKLSAQIYTDTNIDEANVIAANPMDCAIFESLSRFSFDGKGSDGGAIGYSTGSLAQRWKVFSSPVVPAGKVLLMHKPTDIMRVIYVWAPYQPAVMSPYPLGNTPSLTILSRNAKLFYRPLGSAILNINYTNSVDQAPAQSGALSW